MGNVYGYNIECSHIHWKELFNDAECCAELRDYTVSRFLLGSLLVTHVCSVVSLGELPTASPP